MMGFLIGAAAHAARALVHVHLFIQIVIHKAGLCFLGQI